MLKSFSHDHDTIKTLYPETYALLLLLTTTVLQAIENVMLFYPKHK